MEKNNKIFIFLTYTLTDIMKNIDGFRKRIRLSDLIIKLELFAKGELVALLDTLEKTLRLFMSLILFLLKFSFPDFFSPSIQGEHKENLLLNRNIKAV